LLFFIAIQASSQDSAGQRQSSGDSTTTNKTDSTELYGFIPERPVKVGEGPANQKKYLESLRDAQGKKISYERKGSCCEYKTDSPLSLFGMALLDIYEITFRDEADKKKKKSVYITFYDYEEPKPIKGFTIKN